MMDGILRVDRLSMSFGGVHAISELSMAIHANEIVALVGPNGAGKSVFVNLVSGYYAPSAGDIWFAGHKVSTNTAYERSRLGIARTFQNIRLFRRMTVLENVMVALPEFSRSVWRSLRAPLAAKRNACDLLELVGLADKADSLAGALAYGEARSLEIARALATNPRFLMLDEPAAGMNDIETEMLKARLQGIRGHVKAMLVIEHDVSFLTAIADRMLALDQGMLIAEGTPSAVLKDARVVAAYLGATSDV